MTSGVYRINLKGQDVAYIGSSVRIESRWINHRSDLRHGRHHAPYLQRAWDVYGETAFEFTILEVVDDRSKLRAAEAEWMSRHPSRFNNIGPDDSGVLVHSAASREAMSASQKRRFALNPAKPISQQQRAAISAVHKGKIVSDETRRKQSEAAKRKPPISDETRERLRQANYRRTYPPMSEEQRAKLSAIHRARHAALK